MSRKTERSSIKQSLKVWNLEQLVKKKRKSQFSQKYEIALGIFNNLLEAERLDPKESRIRFMRSVNDELERHNLESVSSTEWQQLEKMIASSLEKSNNND